MPEGIVFEAKDARLMTRVSSDKAGVGHYIIKQDFRRDLDQDIRREGYDYFWPNKTGAYSSDPGNQPFPVGGDSEANPDFPALINLVHMARRPNGKTAIIVATKTKIWRFFGMEDGDYYDSNYFEPEPAANAPYYTDNASEWQLIGDGFSEDGHRWEAVDINGYTILSNGVDLPVTYRVEENEVVPIYELREQGIAAVGTIAEINGILVCGNIAEIDSEALIELMNPVGDISSGNVNGSQSGTTVTTPVDFFTDGTGGTVDHTGRTIEWEDGTSTKITAVSDARTVTVNTSVTVENKRFSLRNKATQTGASFSGLVTATVAASSTSVASSAAFFDAGMVGKTIRFPNGFSSVIAAYTDSTHITMTDGPEDAIGGTPFWVSDADELDSSTVNDKLTSDADAFDASMVGRSIVFDDGQSRMIIAYIDARNVKVDSDGSISSGFFKIENLESYAAFTDESKINRIQYRTIWSMPGEPRRFGAIIPATIEEGSQTVNLTFPVKSFEPGQEIVLVGAGVSGGNLTANILNVTQLGKTLLISEKAVTEVTEDDGGFIERSDAIGSIVGFEDLQDDSSSILRMMPLQSTLIIYKETCIFTAVYTGLADNPFLFERLKTPDNFNLYYRWTLIDVGGQFHVFAGANRFYKFELSARTPRPIAELELISDQFFPLATLERTDEIFACDNVLTKEVWFSFPSILSLTPRGKVICYDYDQNSVSTTTIWMTAAATVKKPEVGNSITEDIFVMGMPSGPCLAVYGKADGEQESWGYEREIYYRRGSYPYTTTKTAYDSILKTGLGAFGDPHTEKDAKEFVLYLASQSLNTSIQLSLFGAENPNSSVVAALSYTISSPSLKNMVPTFYRYNYFGHSLTISGTDNPCRISAWSYDVDMINSLSHPRRP